VALTMNKRRYWLWRAVDQDGTVLDILVQSRRDQPAAERFLRRVLDAEDGVEPRVVVTDKLASYPPALRRMLPNSDHRRHKRLNISAENSHRPVRKRERAMQRFKSPEQAQGSLETFSAGCNHFRPRRHRLSAERYRHIKRDSSSGGRSHVCRQQPNGGAITQRPFVNSPSDRSRQSTCQCRHRAILPIPMPT
jgi:putative transposase